jgi:ATP-dependent protease Clp ATPase subunit
VGRLPVIVVFDELNKEDLVDILKNPNNPVLLSKRQDFRAYGIDLKFEEKALEKIAEIAAAAKTGARGLVSAVEKVLIPFEKKLPSTNIKRLLLTPELVDNPEAELRSYLKKYDDPQMLDRFERATYDEIHNIKTFINDRLNHFSQISNLNLYDFRIDLIAQLYLKTTSDINVAFEDFADMVKQIKSEEATLTERLEVDITFDDSAIDELVGKSLESGLEAGSLAFQLAKKIEYGLKLVRDRSGISNFIIDGNAVSDVDSYINNLVKDSYKNEYSPDYDH